MDGDVGIGWNHSTRLRLDPLGQNQVLLVHDAREPRQAFLFGGVRNLEVFQTLSLATTVDGRT